MNRRALVLVIAGAIVVLAVHPWTWPAHGARDALVPGVVCAVTALVAYLCAVRLGDLPAPAMRRPRRRPPRRGPDDVTRAAERIIQMHDRRRR